MKINKEKLQKWLPHIIVLLFIVIVPIFVFDQSNERILFWRYRYYHQLFFMIAAFYVNYLIFVPRLFLSGKRIRFVLTATMFSIFLLLSSQVLSNTFNLNKPPRLNRDDKNRFSENRRDDSYLFGLHPRLFDDALSILLVLGFSTGMGVIRRLRKEENEQKELEKANVETELAFLKNQINPHFFFNSLNNIYALIAVNGDEAQKAVEKLSGLMRYLIYESDVETVQLKKEFEFTRNYIDLMKQRLTSKVKFTAEIQQDLPNIEMPPLIFIPFVENAFKHGISYREVSFINISLHVTDEQIFFSCKNSVPTKPKQDETKNGGVGIANIQKRLQLLYGKTAQLIQTEEKNQFVVELVLPLEQNR